MSIADTLRDISHESALNKAEKISLRVIASHIEKMFGSKEGKCKWAYDNFHEMWETACGNAWTLCDGTPAENRMKFCPFCGLILKN